MHNRSALRAVAAGAVLLPVALLATGCSSLIDELVYKEKHLSFTDAAALADGWDRTPAWIPGDAKDIAGSASTQAADAALLLRSDEELDPALCTVVPRQSAPVYALSDAPNVYEMDEVYACGEWSVVATKDGWLGWTPNHPDEAAQSPAS